MAYSQGNFYHKSGNSTTQYIDNAVVNGVTVITSNVVPTAAILAPTGAICTCTLAGSIAAYINTGTATVPVWKKITQEA